MKNKTVLIAGAGSGIGSALALLLASQGASVYSIDKRTPIEKIPSVQYLSADLTIASEIKEALARIDLPIDILINSAGVMRRGTIFDSEEADYDFIMNNNVKSAWMLLKETNAKLSLDATVVQISSGHAILPVADPGLYTLAKTATAGLAHVLAATRPEYKVQIVYPGPTLTPLLLTGRMEADKERIAKIAHNPDFLAETIAALIGSDYHELRFNYKTNGYDFL